MYLENAVKSYGFVQVTENFFIIDLVVELHLSEHKVILGMLNEGT